MATGRERGTPDEIREQMMDRAARDFERLMRRDAPRIPAVAEAGAIAFSKRVEARFKYLTKEFGFSANYDRGSAWEAFFERGNRCLIVQNDPFVRGLDFALCGGDAEFFDDVALLVERIHNGGVHGLDEDLAEDEWIDRKFTQWADALYPIWPRFLEDRRARPPVESVVEWLCIIGKRCTAAPAPKPPISQAVMLSNEIQTRVGFFEEARSALHFLESEYGFVCDCSCLSTPARNDIVPFSRPLPPESTGVVGVCATYACRSFPAYSVQVVIAPKLRRGAYSPSIAPILGSSDGLNDLLRMQGKTVRLESPFALTREAVRQSLLERAQVLREHCDAILRGDLTVYRQEHERSLRLAREAALAWARKEVDRAWTLKNWREVVRLYDWMGADRITEETVKLADARKALGDAANRSGVPSR